MAARAQRSAPTYFTLKSCRRSSSTTVSIGPVADAEPPGGEPLLTRMCSPPSRSAAWATVASTCSLLVTSAASGMIAARLALQLARDGLEAVLRPGDDRDVDTFARQLERDGLADAETAAGHERTLALQSKIHRVTSLSIGV